MIRGNLKLWHGGDYEQIGLDKICEALHEQRSANAAFRSYPKDGTMF